MRFLTGLLDLVDGTDFAVRMHETVGPDIQGLEGLRLDRDAPARARQRPWIWLLPVPVVVAIAAVVWLRGGVIEVRTAAAVLEGGDARPTVLNASGYVVARRESTVSSKVTGKVVEVLVEEGMQVEEGRVLARLDDSNFRASLGVAEAELEAARAAVGETQARLDEGEKRWQRTTELAKNQVVSPSDIDTAEADVKSLRARLGLQEAQMAVASRQVALRRQDVEDMVIRAPFSGMLVSKNAQPGEMISPISAGGGFTRTGIATVVDMTSLEIEVDVNESYINRVHPGQPVEAMLDAYPEWRIPCKVLAVIPTADRQKATIKVRVSFDALDPRILPQMAVRVAFKGDAKDRGAGVMVPRAALRVEDGRPAVWVVREGRLECRAVEVGSTIEDAVLLSSGLSAGEAVVVEGPEKLVGGRRARQQGR